MVRFKDFGEITSKRFHDEYRGGWRWLIQFRAHQAPKSLTAPMIIEWCREHWGLEHQGELHDESDHLWMFESWRWIYMKHSWQVVEFKVRWFGEGEK